MISIVLAQREEEGATVLCVVNKLTAVEEHFCHGRVAWPSGKAIRGKSGKIALIGYFLSVYVSGGRKQGLQLRGTLDQNYPFLGA